MTSPQINTLLIEAPVGRHFAQLHRDSESLVGSVTLFIETGLRRGTGVGEYVKILIKDQGPGISKEHLDKIFDPFFTTKPTGSGLGLTSSYWIIKRHVGHIFVESEPGQEQPFPYIFPSQRKRAPQNRLPRIL